jgi:predicted DNA-binding transcriptional regulator YafY
MPSDLPSRMLRLLALLQSHREWSGAELATRLGVTDRTVRRDIERLRELGYRVEGSVGQGGGYRLATGAKIPPLLLDDEEAVAIAVGLISAASGVAGIQETALRALAKLQLVLPARVRERIAAVQQATVLMTLRDGPQVDVQTLAVLAAACRNSEIVTFAYRSRAGKRTSRRVEPHSLVSAFGRWFLIAFDTEHDDWRSFRLDRLTEPNVTGRRVPQRRLPAADPAAYLAQALATAPHRYNVRATVHAPADVVAARTGALPGRIESVDEQTCTVNVSDDSLDYIAHHLVDLDADFTINDGHPELRARLRELAERLYRAADI